jgi:hypothetical protein
MTTFPIFAPLKNSLLTVPGRLRETAAALRINAVEDLVTYDSQRSVHDKDGLLSRKAGLDAVSVSHKTAEGQKIPGLHSSYHSLNLTYDSNCEDSKYNQFYRDSSGALKAFVFKKDAKWIWREDLNESSEIMKFAESLDFLEATLVRIIYLTPPAAGGVHIDTHPRSMKEYYESGYASLTFNLKSAGASLYFSNGDSAFQIPNTLSAWHFDPSAPHCVGPVDQERIQLRVFGKLKNCQYADLLNLNEAVWRKGEIPNS